MARRLDLFPPWWAKLQLYSVRWKRMRNSKIPSVQPDSGLPLEPLFDVEAVGDSTSRDPTNTGQADRLPTIEENFAQLAELVYLSWLQLAGFLRICQFSKQDNWKTPRQDSGSGSTFPPFFELRSSACSRRAFYTMAAVFLAQGLFVLFRFGQRLADDPTVNQSSVIHFLYVEYHLVCSVYWITQLWCSKEMVRLLNATNSLTGFFKEVGFCKKRWSCCWLASYFVIAVPIFCTLSIVIVTAYFVSSPYESQYLYSVLPDKSWIFGCCLVWEAVVVFLGFLNNFLCLFIFVHYVYSSKTWMAALLAHCKKTEKKDRELGPISALEMKVYQLLWLHNNAGNAYTGSFFLPGSLAAYFLMAVCSIYGMLTTYSLLPWFIYSLFPGLLSVPVGALFFWLKELTDIRKTSGEILGLMGRKPLQCKRERKQLASFPVLRVQNGGFGVITLMTSKSMVEEIINYLLVMMTNVK